MIDIKKQTAMFMMKYFDLPVETTETMFTAGVLEENVCKKVLIRHEFHNASGKKGEIKESIADKYCVSISTVEKIIHKA